MMRVLLKLSWNKEENMLSPRIFLFQVNHDTRCLAWSNKSHAWVDTSEYPGSHSLFCYSPDADISSRLQSVIDGIAEELPRPITETIEEFIASVARAIGVSTQVESTARKHHTTDEEDEAQSGDDYDDYDEYDEFDIGSTKVEPNTLLTKLQEYVCVPSDLPHIYHFSAGILLILWRRNIAQGLFASVETTLFFQFPFRWLLWRIQFRLVPWWPGTAVFFLVLSI